jgi:plastocyanin
MSRTLAPAAIAWLAITVAAVLLAGGIVMGIAMADHMNGGMMHRRGDSGPQTPVVATSRDVSVEIRNYDYLPRDLTIDAGSTVTWTNYDDAPHTATEQDDAWGSGRLDRNEIAALSFEAAGRYEYYCTYHPYMKATLTVR